MEVRGAVVPAATGGRPGSGRILDGRRLPVAQDAENDPLAFAGPRLGNAHNEWLEALANLGAIGIALLGLGYGLTFWESRHVLARLGGTVEGWCFVGLLAALAGLAAEEATNVALHNPGLPAVWYTVLGLTSALMRRDERGERPACATAGRARGRRHGGRRGGRQLRELERRKLAGGAGGGSRADAAAATALGGGGEGGDDRKPPPACGKRGRGLGVPEVPTHAQIADFHLGALDAAARDRSLSLTRGTPAGDLHRQDLETARTHILAARQEANALLKAIPQYPYVAGRLGQLLAAWLPVEARLVAELPADRIDAIRQEARTLLLQEYLRNRLDAQAALHVVAAWPDQAIADRIDCLRTGRAGGRRPSIATRCTP